MIWRIFSEFFGKILKLFDILSMNGCCNQVGVEHLPQCHTFPRWFTCLYLRSYTSLCAFLYKLLFNRTLEQLFPACCYSVSCHNSCYFCWETMARCQLRAKKRNEIRKCAEHRVLLSNEKNVVKRMLYHEFFYDGTDFFLVKSKRGKFM